MNFRMNQLKALPFALNSINNTIDNLSQTSTVNLKVKKIGLAAIGLGILYTGIINRSLTLSIISATGLAFTYKLHPPIKLHPSIIEIFKKGSDQEVQSILASDKISSKSLNIKNSDGNTPLMLIARRGSDETIKALLASDKVTTESLNIKNSNGITPLMLIGERGSDETIKYLLASDKVTAESLNITDNHKNSSIMIMASKGSDKTLKDLLASDKVTAKSLSIQNTDGITPLMLIVERGSDETIQALYESNKFTAKSLNIKDIYGNSVGMLLLNRSSDATLQLLLNFNKASSEPSTQPPIIIGKDIKFQKSLPIPDLPCCTSWADSGSGERNFRDYVESITKNIDSNTDLLALLAIAWSSHNEELFYSARLIADERYKAGHSIPDVKRHFDDILNGKGSNLAVNAILRYHILKHIPSANLQDADFRDLLIYRTMVSNMSAKIGYIINTLPGINTSSTDHTTIKHFFADISSLIKALKNRDKQNIFQMKDGSHAIAIPFGIITHPIMCLFILDKNDKYHLRVFNKGLQPNPNPFLRKQEMFRVNGDDYIKSNILISDIDPKFIFDATMLKQLLVNRCSQFGNIENVYNAIYKGAIENGKGMVIESSEELEYYKFQDQLKEAVRNSAEANSRTKKANALRKNMVEKTPYIQKTMPIGACFEANAATPEEFIASPEVLNKVHSFSLQVLADTLGDRPITTEESSCRSLALRRISLITTPLSKPAHRLLTSITKFRMSETTQ